MKIPKGVSPSHLHFVNIHIESLLVNRRQRKPNGKIKNGQSRDTGNIAYHIQNEDKESKAQTTIMMNNICIVEYCYIIKLI